ncbi:hypothetical protein COLO4_37076 [Corchorus olitorius]|uniref:Uncharacterized protein n=1 Tax=Corchorus olitorius TaxID=93759 RepID=A0A1R3G3D5_9ROSI|nr:hypothetical protein COLO4_37076 [Corchorus olitorius]
MSLKLEYVICPPSLCKTHLTNLRSKPSATWAAPFNLPITVLNISLLATVLFFSCSLDNLLQFVLVLAVFKCLLSKLQLPWSYLNATAMLAFVE